MVALEIRHVIRSLWRAPLFAVVVVLLLALGIRAAVTQPSQALRDE